MQGERHERTRKNCSGYGCEQGPGFEAARRLAERGVKALLGARSEERGKEVEAKLRGEGFEAEFILLDVNDEKTSESAARVIKEKFGKLDILVNNAGSALEKFSRPRNSGGQSNADGDLPQNLRSEFSPCSR